MDKSVLIIYTGGTIGMVNDPETGSLRPYDFSEIEKNTPEIKEFGFNIDSYTLQQIIDSSDVNPNLWDELAHIIYDNYNKYDGFVVLHGTDTMAYSASALSFMLRNLKKPVVFTGSQLPIGTIRTDGRENLVTAIEIAAASRNGMAIVPEVSILFGDKLFRGNRTTKSNAESFDAFSSFNYPPLANIGIHINYNFSHINYYTGEEEFYISCGMSSSIAVIKLFPGIHPSIIEGIISLNDVEGIILETFGAGNAPSNHEFINILKMATDKSKIIYNVTQCQGGRVEMGRYSTSKELLDMGVISGFDITIEAAICKMMHTLSLSKNDTERKILLNTPICGENSTYSFAL